MTLQNRLSTWAALRAGVVKPRTREYHQELIEFIGRNWPEKFTTPADEISEADVGAFIERIKERPLLNQLEFNRLLDDLDHLNRSHAGLVIRFLSHTGLRIAEAARIRWQNVHDDFLLVPGSASKNGRPRVIPFVNGARDALEGLRRAGGDRETVFCRRWNANAL